ncbi:MAG TPA: hypothetical protein VIG79_15125 [Lapillicoccus sp.]
MATHPERDRLLRPAFRHVLALGLAAYGGSPTRLVTLPMWLTIVPFCNK